MYKKLRLLLFEECNRNCEGCCNKDWNLKTLPIAKDFYNYNKIMVTGGEPMLRPKYLINTLINLRYKAPNALLILYTAKVDDLLHTFKVLKFIDGMTLTLHEQSDVKYLVKFDILLSKSNFYLNEYFRLNVFKGIKIPKLLNNWKIKENVEWIKNCPLPKDEIFMRL